MTGTAGPGPVLVLGADGFIGRHIAFGLRAAGWTVTASARRTGRLRAMGFDVLAADLTDPATHDPAFWRAHATGAVVNAAGLLTGAEADFRAVHRDAPRAAYAARPEGAPAVLISAVGIDADTPFARHRREGEAIAQGYGVTILRPGLVLGDTSYGGSSLLRALSALPFATPVVGRGEQVFNPIHATDLADVVAACLTAPPGPGPWDIGGPEDITQADLAGLYRRWLGLDPVPALRLPLSVAQTMGRVGDALRIGPVSATAVAQLEHGVRADPAPILTRIAPRPRAVSAFVMERPAGTQDLWQARLYLMKPAIRLVLALMWGVSGLMGLFLPARDFLPVLPDLPGALAIAAARLGGIADLALAAALIRNWRPRATALAQLGLVAAYTVGFTLLAPGEWLAPLGGLLKNLPVLALIAVHLALADER